MSLLNTNDDSRKILVLYGSQTGYAEDTARRIGRQAWQRHFTATVKPMDEIDRRTALEQSAASCPVAIFVCSTTGQGMQPDNMRKFWRFLLRKSLPNDALKGLRFAVFGLGDSSYAEYNFAAKRLFRRLVQLGAEPVVARGDGDDQHYLGADGALVPWLESLWSALDALYPMPRSKIADDIVPPPAFGVSLIEGTVPAEQQPEAADGLGEGWFDARMAANERLTAAEHFQDVRRVSFAPEDPVEWTPGDWAVLRPRNQDTSVNEFLRLMSWTDIADKPLSVRGASNVPEVTTLRWLATHHLDVTAVPRRSFFEMLWFFCEHEDEREKLNELTSSAGQDDLLAYCMRPRRTILEVLSDFPHSRIPLSYVLDAFPAIATRSFSISSDRGTVDLTVAIVRYKTIMYIPRTGLCTQWLAHMQLGTPVRMRIERGTMRLPQDPRTPVIMVGPGTGIAAFMAFIRERVCQGATDTHLFFGCRGKEMDFLYRDQLNQWVDQGVLHLYCAFSRDQPERRTYVQNRIAEESAGMWELLERGAVIYVSGNARQMPQDVRQAFVNAVSRHGHLESNDDDVDADADAEAYIRRMQRTGRYQEECWF
ncbi:NAPDH-dependent diflavin reductase [Coemansia asiatica]|uniref:NADPH-dependent diflavin oxidoreductase 1 n=1 Tax=Coemansia asiatica TaxID=1052880 RepID=A0A9W7XPY9_9FUNG|nr:NAPDH-dependent diflavin reductase [Coemansia asiatica]